LEVHNLPLVARNPYNFALVQPGVTGFENVEFGVPRLAANGAAMRINYMIDGNTNTEKDRPGLRLLPMSEVMIQEVKVVTTDLAPALGLKEQPVAVPNVQTAKFAIGKGDYQINGNNRLTARWIRFHNDAPYNSGGGTATLERATDFLDAMDSTAGQLVSSIGSNALNELRFQYAHRHQQSVANSDSGTGPAVTISGVAG